MTLSTGSDAPIAASRRAEIEGHEARPLADGWRVASTPPGLFAGPDELGAASWLEASAPGTAAAALAAAGLWRAGDSYDFDEEDWWFRTCFDAEPPSPGEQLLLHLDGIATLAEVYLNGALVLSSESMFASHSLDVGAALRATNELVICCRALGPRLREPRRPRARWRTRLVASGNLRFFRTMLLGRAPGFAPGPAAVGPWRAVWLQRRRGLALDALEMRARLVERTGVLSLSATLRALASSPPRSVELELTGPTGAHRATLVLAGDGDAVTATGELRVPEVARWWPHTHGEPALYDVRLLALGDGARIRIDVGRAGFRELAAGAGPGHDLERDGLDLHVNGVRVFARGALWTPLDPASPTAGEPDLRRALLQARDAGMNMLRLAGTGAYETSAFHDLCDELGILVWQDFMFANLDYPVSEEPWRATVVEEVAQELGRLAGRASLAVLCGNSEVEQQVAMLGLDWRMGRGELFDSLLPSLVADSGADAIYIPSAPCGGDLPFRTDAGVANYFGVGGYRRPLTDARRADVRFASECLALSNVPCETTIETIAPDRPAAEVVNDPIWKQRVPRDAGADWNFEDVRDHYLSELFGVHAQTLRRADAERYLELSRAVSGVVMAEVFGEWRTSRSRCGGGLVLWLRDLVAGAGWGVLDSRGEPKVAYHHLRRALAPRAVWITDEGLNGLDMHVANDGPDRLEGRLRVALYSDLERRVEERAQTVELDAHTTGRWGVEAVLGHFVDASWAYRFGAPAHNLVVASLEGEGESGPATISQSMCFVATTAHLDAEPAERLGLTASAELVAGGALHLTVRSRRLAHGVRVHVRGFAASDDAFSIEPGAARTVELHPCDPGTVFEGGTLTALNLSGSLEIDPSGSHG
jgi:beta-mannosidase